MSTPDTLDGPEELRATVALINGMRETFNAMHKPAELLKLGRVYRACKWDIAPDRWAPAQVRAALRSGTVPTFEDRE